VSPEQIQDRLRRHVRFRRIPVARAGRLDASDAHLVKPGRIFDKTFPMDRILAILTVSPKGPRARPPAPEAAYQRIGDEVENMEDRLCRLDAAREALALKQASPGLRATEAKRNGPQALDNTGNRETADSPPPMISET
jgi:hypothetical protein